jgi:hypothetical protein
MLKLLGPIVIHEIDGWGKLRFFQVQFFHLPTGVQDNAISIYKQTKPDQFVENKWRA